MVSTPVRLLLGMVLVEAVAAGRCDGPYKTLTSDCRGLAVDANTVCVILDQSTNQPSPCTKRTTTQSVCAARPDQPCDILTYRIDYQTGIARFRIAFPANDSALSRHRRLAETNQTTVPTSVPPSVPSPTATPASTTGKPEIVVDFDTSNPPVTSAPPTSTPQTSEVGILPLSTTTTPSDTPSPPVTSAPTTNAPELSDVGILPASTTPTTPSPTTGTPEIVVDYDTPSPPITSAPPTTPQASEIGILPPNPTTTTPSPSTGTPEIIVDFGTPSPPVTSAPTARTPQGSEVGILTPSPVNPPASTLPSNGVPVATPSTPSPPGTVVTVNTARPTSGMTSAPTTAGTPGSAVALPSSGAPSSTVGSITRTSGSSPSTTTSGTVNSIPTTGTVVSSSNALRPATGSSTSASVSTQGNSPETSTTAPPVNSFTSLGVSAESNEYVNAIGQLRLDRSVTELRIVGGSSELGTRGVAVQLTMDPHMLAHSPLVTSLWIANCNISAQLSTGDVMAVLPRGLSDLNLRNTLIKQVPTNLELLQSLKTLQLAQNYLTTLSSNISLPQLTFLDLSENAMVSLEWSLPVLETLYLNKNNFNAIPTTTYSMSKLQDLQMTENPIVAIVVSTTQFNFLARLRLKIDKPPTTPPAPVIYVAQTKTFGHRTRVLAGGIAALNLSNPDVDLNNSVALPVGNLTDLQGLSVWKLSDEEYAVFQAQQQVISTSSIVVNGTKVQSYLAMAAAGAVVAVTIPAPSTTAPESLTTSSPSHGSSGSKSHTTLAIVIASVAAVLVLVAVILFVIQRRRRNGKNGTTATETMVTSPSEQPTTAFYQSATNTKTNNTESSIDSFGEWAATISDDSVRDLFTSRRLRVADIQDVRPIGSGANGIVWLVKHRGSRLLASKRMIPNTTTQRMNEFVNEIVIAADLDYPRILRLVGVAWTSRSDLQALYEYMPNGDLETHLKTTRPSSFPWQGAKITMAIDIIEALVYTHSFNPPLLHRDLRARNVLLDDKMHPKLSNFGSARFASEQNTMTTDGIGSSRWIAPEIVRGSTDYDAPSDVYAFGVLLCELDTHATPFEHIQDANGTILSEVQVMDLVARGEIQPTLSPSCPPALRTIIQECLSYDPHARPTSMRVAYELRLLARKWTSTT